jgi:hypothetical protein
MTHAVALQYSPADAVLEYHKKAKDLANQIELFHLQKEALEYACTIKGTFTDNIFEQHIGGLHEPSLQKKLLRSAWKCVYNELNIDSVAPVSDRKKFELSITNPPEFTVDNIIATFGDYIVNRRYHILRGLAEVFCQLDSAYKSHSNVKIGVEGLPKRIILNNVVGPNSFRSWGREKLKDMFDALLTYKNLPCLGYGDFADIVRDIEAEKNCDCKHSGLKGISFKCFGNGNVHVIFDKHTLTEINLALAEFYGDVLPDTAEAFTEKETRDVTVAKDLQFYPTPQAVIDRVLSDVHLKEGMKVLEPSCGDGRIMLTIKKQQPKIDLLGIEIDEGRREYCVSNGLSVYLGNFLELPLDTDYDLIVMNPPFYGEHWMKHVAKAKECLKDRGTLICILPASAKDKLERLDIPTNTWRDLPIASFRESGTNIGTGYISYTKR